MKDNIRLFVCNDLPVIACSAPDKSPPKTVGLTFAAAVKVLDSVAVLRCADVLVQ
jgi:hypothetical protein